MADRTVAIVGGGCAGVLATRELLHGTDDDVVLIEPDEPGGGLAYGSARPWHLLNSRAGAMSADPDDPGHFARWAGCSPDDFRPRAEYGRYLRSVFASVAAEHGDRLTVRRSHAAGLTADGVQLADGQQVRVRSVVVATGNPAPAQPAAVPDHPDYVADPWVKGVLEAIPSDVPVLLVGAGLTAIDVAMTLTAERDRDAPITAVSRRGQLPLTHTAVAAPPIGLRLDDCATLRDIVRAVRAEAARAGDWRAVVDGLRPYLDELWTAFTPDEQDAFLRHLARPWECHRHRMAPQVGARVAELRDEGRLEVRAGGVRSLSAPPAGGLLVELEAGVQWFGAVVNCAGPGRLPAATGTFVGSLLAAGQARVGPHGLGLDIDASGRLVGADGRVQPDRRLIGPLRRGAKWETTAVPEIRAQARNLAIPVE
ncbi:MAG TPA: FAD/NAD(P)-binding protein [Actinoplanes sp.]|nr:FAD/NAD(P)-binding protein [Actinoplanes sp.]